MSTNKKTNKMKKMCILLICMITMNLSAQIMDSKVNDQILIDRIYAGSLSSVMFPVDSMCALGGTNIRVGAMATYTPASWISLSAWALLQAEGSSSLWSAQQLYMTLRPTKKLTIQLGSMASVPTEMRPHPVSGAGQFETWTTSQIPAGGLGVKAKYQLTPNFQLSSGVVMRKNKPEYSLKVGYKHVQLGVWYSSVDTTAGIAASINWRRLVTTWVYKPNQTIASMWVIKISKKYDMSLYADMGYDFQKKQLVRGEWGVLKTFDSKWIDGLFGLGYRHEARSIAGYLFIHL